MATVGTLSATLSELPDELILEITEHLAISSAFDLLELSLVNWRFRRVTLPKIYAEFSGEYPTHFLRTIALPPPAGRSELAMRVKRVRWDCDPPIVSPYGSGNEVSDISASDRWAITRAHQQLVLATPPEGQPSLDSQFARLVRGPLYMHHWALDFFLMFLANVEEVDVYSTWQWDDHKYWFTHVAANAERFKHLKSIMLGGPMRIENIMPLLTMPSLKDLRLDEVIVMRRNADDVFSWEQPDRLILENASSGIEKLTMKYSYLPTASIVSILDLIKGLKYFGYEHEQNDLSIDPEDTIPIDYASLVNALLRHTSTLEDVCFKIYIAPPNEWQQLDLDKLVENAAAEDASAV
jgi:hypothetical protein